MAQPYAKKDDDHDDECTLSAFFSVLMNLGFSGFVARR